MGGLLDECLLTPEEMAARTAASAEANADVLQVAAFDALMAAQESEDTGAAEAATKAQAKADAAKAYAAELKIAAVRVQMDTTNASAAAVSGPARKAKQSGGFLCCGSRPNQHEAGPAAAR